MGVLWSWLGSREIPWALVCLPPLVPGQQEQLLPRALGRQRLPMPLVPGQHDQLRSPELLQENMREQRFPLSTSCSPCLQFNGSRWAFWYQHVLASVKPEPHSQAVGGFPRASAVDAASKPWSSSHSPSYCLCLVSALHFHHMLAKL